MTHPQDLPYLGMCFEVLFEPHSKRPASAKGGELGTFSECSGLLVDIGSEDYKEGGNNQFVHKLPAHAASPALVLKRGLTSATGLWDWIRTFLESSTVEPATVQVQLRSPGTDGTVLRTWVVHHAYPLKWEGPKLDASSGAVAFESVELAHRGVTLGK